MTESTAKALAKIISSLEKHNVLYKGHEFYGPMYTEVIEFFKEDKKEVVNTDSSNIDDIIDKSIVLYIFMLEKIPVLGDIKLLPEAIAYVSEVLFDFRAKKEEFVLEFSMGKLFKSFFLSQFGKVLNLISLAKSANNVCEIFNMFIKENSSIFHDLLKKINEIKKDLGKFTTIKYRKSCQSPEFALKVKQFLEDPNLLNSNSNSNSNQNNSCSFYPPFPLNTFQPTSSGFFSVPSEFFSIETSQLIVISNEKKKLTSETSCIKKMADYLSSNNRMPLFENKEKNNAPFEYFLNIIATFACVKMQGIKKSGYSFDKELEASKLLDFSDENFKALLEENLKGEKKDFNDFFDVLKFKYARDSIVEIICIERTKLSKNQVDHAYDSYYDDEEEDDFFSSAWFEEVGDSIKKQLSQIDEMCRELTDAVVEAKCEMNMQKMAQQVTSSTSFIKPPGS